MAIITKKQVMEIRRGNPALIYTHDACAIVGTLYTLWSIAEAAEKGLHHMGCDQHAAKIRKVLAALRSPEAGK